MIERKNVVPEVEFVELETGARAEGGVAGKAARVVAGIMGKATKKCAPHPGPLPARPGRGDKMNFLFVTWFRKLGGLSKLFVRCQLALDCGKDGVDRHVAHASMVFERAFTLLAGATIKLKLQVLTSLVMRFAPGDMSRTEQCDDGSPERRCKMSRPRIGRDE